MELVYLNSFGMSRVTGPAHEVMKDCSVRGTGLDSVQSFPSKSVVVPFQIVRAVFLCSVALEEQVDSKLLGLV